jgi:hypothetical protein
MVEPFPSIIERCVIWAVKIEIKILTAKQNGSVTDSIVSQHASSPSAGPWTLLPCPTNAIPGPGIAEESGLSAEAAKKNGNGEVLRVTSSESRSETSPAVVAPRRVMDRASWVER